MSLEQSLSTILDNNNIIERNTFSVYEAGISYHQKSFVNEYSQNGERTNWKSAFAGLGWTNSLFEMFLSVGTIRPQIARYMFQSSMIDNISVSQVDFSDSTDMRDVFAGSSIVSLELKIGESPLFNNTSFSDCANLTELRVIGTLSVSGVNLQWSNLLSKESFVSVFNSLSTTTSGLSITFSKSAINNAFGIDVDDETTYPEGSEYYELRHSRDNWTINYI
jgi:hypothetical protein